MKYNYLQKVYYKDYLKSLTNINEYVEKKMEYNFLILNKILILRLTKVRNMLRKRYYFNATTCRYEPVLFSWTDIVSQIKISVYTGLVLAAITLGLFYLIIGSPKAYWLQSRSEYYKSILAEQNHQFSSYSQRLNKIHDLDDHFYRSLLNVQPMESNLWEAGRGGALHPKSTNPIIKQSQTLIQTLSYRLDLQKKAFSKTYEIAEKKQEELQGIPAIKPIASRIVSGFGYRNDPYLGHWHLHTGLDFHAYMNTPVKATAGGRVICAGYSSTGVGYGIQVEIDHGNGYITKYAHLSKVKVKYGQKVKRGEIIGLTGNTGWSTGPHLHYEVIKNGVKVDPSDYFYSVK